MPLNRLENFIKNIEGRILYVNPNDLDSTDSITNDGNSLAQPFKTIQRALIESARFSYVTGRNNDRIERTTILVYPGDHTIDNRPGFGIKPSSTNPNVATAVAPGGIETTPASDKFSLDLESNFDLTQEDNILYKFNSVNGGVIVPRGTSLVGLDLRKTKIKPKYVPNPTDSSVPNSALFRITGTCYFWQFSIFDGDKNGTVYINDKDFTGQNKTATPLFSHHKLTCFEYADGVNKVFGYNNTDLEMYYDKLSNAFNEAAATKVIPSIDKFPVNPEGFAPQRPEFEIVGAFAADPIEISAIQSGNGVIPTQQVTVTTKTEHELNVGTPIQVKGVVEGTNTNLPYNTSSFVQEVVSPTVFTYLTKGNFTNVPPASGGSLSVATASIVVETDTVSGASPYIFNCSLRSVYGMNGMIADGAKATGFRSMVVAQFTGISLQKDDRAFVKYSEVDRQYNGVTFTDPTEGADLVAGAAQADSSQIYHLDSDAIYRRGFETCHITMKNDAILQIVSVFAIGYAKHFSAESGGDASVTNSNSNFGQISLNSDGFKKEAFRKDDTAYVTSLVTPKSITSTTEKIDWFKINVGLTSTTNISNHLYIDGFTDPDDAPPSLTAGFRVGAALTETLYIPCGDDPATVVEKQAFVRMVDGFTGSGQLTASGSSISVKRYDVTSGPTNTGVLTIGTHQLQTGEKIRIISDDGDLPENVEENTVYFAIVISSTEIKLASSKTDADNGEGIVIHKGTKLKIESRVHDKESGDVGSPIFFDSTQNNWCINVDPNASRLSYFQGSNLGKSNSTFITRKTDSRSLDDKIYKLRVVVPKEVTNGKNPEESFIIQESSSTGYRNATDHSATSIVSADHAFNRNLRFITSSTVLGSTVTVTTSLPHNLDVDEKVLIKKVKSDTNITGADNLGYNGTFIVASIPSNKTFTYSVTDVDGVSHNVGTFTAGQLNTRDIDLPRFERSDILSNFYIYRNETIKQYIEGQQDGIYNLFVLNADNAISEEFTNFKYSQNVVDLYPQLDRDNLDDNPSASVSFAKRSPLGDVATNSLKNSLTRETNDKLFKKFGLGLKISSVGTDTNEAELTFDREHNFGGLVEGTVQANSNFTNGTHYDVKILDTSPTPTGSNWNGATANVTVSLGSITDVVVVASGSNYIAGTYYFDNTSTLGSGNGGSYVVTNNGIRGNIGDIVQVTGIGTETDSYSKITDINSTKKISIKKTGTDPLPKAGQFLIHLGPEVVISGNSFDNPTKVTTLTTSSAHGLVKGNSFRVLDSSNSNLGDFIVKDRISVTQFTCETTTALSNPSSIIKHGMSANNGDSDAERNLSFYDGDVLILKNNSTLPEGGSGIGRGESEVKLKVQAPGSQIGIMARFPLGSYIQVDNEIMRVASSTLSGSGNDELTVIRGVLGSDKDEHILNSLIKKIKPLPIEFRRPSIIRASGHTFEYVGYGPGNYSTGLPQVQVKTLTEREEFLVQSQERSCGAVVYTGMNNRGDFFIGNKRVSSTTGQERTFDAPIPTVTGEDPARLSVIFDEVIAKERILVEGGKSNEILSQFDGPVTFNNSVKMNKNLIVSGDVKFSGDVEFTSTSSEYTTDSLFKANIKLQDNKRVLLGNGPGIATDASDGSADCEIYHDGGNTRIDQLSNGTGNLRLQHGGSTKIEVNPDGSVLSGITTVGILTSSGTITSNKLEANSTVTAGISIDAVNSNDTNKASLTSDGGIELARSSSTTNPVNKQGPYIDFKRDISSPPSGALNPDDFDARIIMDRKDDIDDSAAGELIFITPTGTVPIPMHGQNVSEKFRVTRDGARVTGELEVTGDITALTSDIRLKTNIEQIDNALDRVCQISGFTYEHNELAKLKCDIDTGDQRYVGVSAQDVQQVLPEAVKRAPSNNDYLTVQYEKLVPLLIEAIKELKNEIDELKNNK